MVDFTNVLTQGRRVEGEIQLQRWPYQVSFLATVCVIKKFTHCTLLLYVSTIKISMVCYHTLFLLVLYFICTCFVLHYLRSFVLVLTYTP